MSSENYKGNCGYLDFTKVPNGWTKWTKVVFVGHQMENIATARQADLGPSVAHKYTMNIN